MPQVKLLKRGKVVHEFSVPEIKAEHEIRDEKTGKIVGYRGHDEIVFFEGLTYKSAGWVSPPDRRDPETKEIVSVWPYFTYEWDGKMPQADVPVEILPQAPAGMKYALVPMADEEPAKK